MARIVVLDDEAEARDTIALSLEQEGHEVARASDIAQAEQLLAKEPADLMILDLILPGQDGLAYLRELVEQERTKDMPVIIVSALRQKRRIVEGLKAGAIDYITKPFELVELKMRVTAALKIHDLKRERARNRQLEAMRETARTVQYEIKLPMHEIQKRLIQLRNEMEDFAPEDQALVQQAWEYFSSLEDILSQAEHTGILQA
ncbi:MAG TPA: response regulator transcription factor [Firmicutes bacterium]|nr:response regulator transcription factor [Bacillota bacterium]